MDLYGNYLFSSSKNKYSDLSLPEFGFLKNKAEPRDVN
jgi:hypothetical protein